MADGSFFDRVGTDTRKTTKPQNGNDLQVGRVIPDELHSVVSDAGETPRWSKNDNIFWPASKTCEVLEPGFYQFESQPNIGTCVRKTNISTDNLIRLPDTATAKVLLEFTTFWNLKDRFAEHGFLHKRGILLWGPPGSGKTVSLMLMAEEIITKHGGIVCQIDHPGLASMGLAMIRKIEPERPIVALIEDLDALVDRHSENHFLSLLDGETQVDRIVYIATTNYPERLDKRFVDRPSRFDTIEWIGMPSAAARRVYLEHKAPTLSTAELNEWVSVTEGFSVAHLRELVILVQCFDRPLKDGIKRLEAMRFKTPNSGDAPDKPTFGFGRTAAQNKPAFGFDGTASPDMFK